MRKGTKTKSMATALTLPVKHIKMVYDNAAVAANVAKRCNNRIYAATDAYFDPHETKCKLVKTNQIFKNGT